jgi:hypothetical protein
MPPPTHVVAKSLPDRTAKEQSFVALGKIG